MIFARSRSVIAVNSDERYSARHPHRGTRHVEHKRRKGMFAKNKPTHEQSLGFAQQLAHHSNKAVFVLNKLFGKRKRHSS